MRISAAADQLWGETHKAERRAESASAVAGLGLGTGTANTSVAKPNKMLQLMRETPRCMVAGGIDD